MANVRLWSGVEVSLTSATSTPITISNITKASPPVVTFTGTAPANGDVVWIQAAGMTQVNERAFRVGGVSGSTFQLVGEDSTQYDTFVSGTATRHTMGTNMNSARGVSAAGGEASEVDISTIHDLVRRTMPGPASASTFDFDCFWDPGDPASIALKRASDSRTRLVASIGFADGSGVLFAGYVSASGLPTGQAQDAVTTSVRLTMAGRATTYAS